eukprot:g39358.t1
MLTALKHWIPKRDKESSDTQQQDSKDWLDVEVEDELETDDDEHEEAQRPLLLKEFLGHLAGKYDMADCFFIVGQGKEQVEMPAHRIVLSACSPIFEAMLYPSLFPNESSTSPLKEEPEPTIVLEDTDPAAFLVMLQCVYSDVANIQPGNIRQLLKLATKYQVEKLQMLCYEYLANDITAENACELYQMSPQLLGEDFALDFILLNAEEVFETKTFLELSKENLLPLLRSDELCIEEGPLFRHVLRWAQHQLTQAGRPTSPQELKQLLHDVIPCIRFPTMSVEDIAGFVSGSGLLSNETLLSLFQCLAIQDTKLLGRLNTEFNAQARSGMDMWDDSKILVKKHRKDLLKMFNKKKNVKLKLLYRCTRDGGSAANFHRICDNKGATLTVVKAAHNDNIFGGYVDASWTSSGNYINPEAFLFSLHNASGKPMKILPTGSGSNNVLCNRNYGPTFGAGHDLHIASAMNSNSNHSSPSSYKNIAPGYSGTFTDSTLAGTRNFVVGELEVFTVSSSPTQ